MFDCIKTDPTQAKLLDDPLPKAIHVLLNLGMREVKVRVHQVIIVTFVLIDAFRPVLAIPNNAIYGIPLGCSVVVNSRKVVPDLLLVQEI